MKLAYLIAVMTVMPLALATAEAPSTYAIDYKCLTDPGDPNSNLKLVFRATLSPGEEAGAMIGWEVDSILIRYYDSGGGYTEWVDDNPAVPSPDGLWWIKHGDASAPQLSEFAYPPRIQSTASASDPSDSDLIYDISGAAHSGSSQSFDAALNYKITLDDPNPPPTPAEPTEPEEEEEEEPVILDEPVLPPL